MSFRSSLLRASLLLLAGASVFVGCPPQTGPKAAFKAEPESGPAPLTVQFTDLSLAGSEAISDWYWEFGDQQTSDQQDPSHEYSAPGAYAVTLTITTSVGSDTSPAKTIVVTSIEGNWGGYWWYQGTEGDVYITWDYHAGQFITEIPVAAVTCKGTYTVDAAADPKTIDLTVTESNTAAWVVGNTYRGYYDIRSSRLYRSQMFETRPVWSSSVLDPNAGIVFVADPI